MKSDLSRIGVTTSAMLLGGAVITYIACVFWFLVPNQTYICELRKWFTALGYSILLSAMFARIWGMHKIFMIVKKNNNLKKDIIRLWEVGGVIGIVIGVQIILLVIWSSVDTFASKSYVYDSLNNLGSYQCTSQYNWVWFGLEIAYFVILLLWGLFVVYRTWDMKGTVRESKWLMISIYNDLLVLLFIVPFVSTLATTDDIIFFVAVACIDLTTGSVVAALCVPNLVRVIARSFSYEFDEKSNPKSEKDTKDTASVEEN